MAAPPTVISMVTTPPRAASQRLGFGPEITQFSVPAAPPPPGFGSSPVVYKIVRVSSATPAAPAPTQLTPPPTQVATPGWMRAASEDLRSGDLLGMQPAMLTPKLAPPTQTIEDLNGSATRSLQSLPRASHVVPSEVAAFTSEAKLLSERPAPMVQATMMSERQLAMVQAVQEANLASPERMSSGSGADSEVMSLPATPPRSNLPAQVAAVQFPWPTPSRISKVPSSPSEPDPLMWSDGLKTLGQYMAAKAMGNMPPCYEQGEGPPAASAMLTLPTKFFDVDIEKAGWQLPSLPVPTKDMDLSKDFPTPPFESGALTAGLADPETVERCRDSYNLELDAQLEEATRRLEEANAAKKMRLRQEARRKIQQHHEEVESQLLEQAAVVVERFHDRMVVLQREADRQRQRLEREAADLMRDSQRYYHFKAEARRLLGSTTSSCRGLGGYQQLPRMEDDDFQPLPTLLSQRAPDIHTLLKGALPGPSTFAPPAPPPPPPKRAGDVPPPSQTSVASLHPPTQGPCHQAGGLTMGSMGPAGPAAKVPSHPSPSPTPQAVPVMAPLRCQSTASAGVSPMSATRFLQMVHRGTQAGSPPGPSRGPTFHGGPSPGATFHGITQWTPPETPRPCQPNACPAPHMPMMPSPSPLGALQMPQGAAPKVWHPAPRGVSQQFPDTLYLPGDIMGNFANPSNPMPTPCRTAMSDLSERVTSM